MTKMIWATLVALFCYHGSANATLNVVATYGWIGDLAQQIGGERVTVSVLAQPEFDPHFVPPKPSLSVKLRNADLLIINGGQLEIGWLPPVLRQASNARIQPNTTGFLDLSTQVNLSNPRSHASRADGDVHPDGNPHYVLNPMNMPTLAFSVAHQLCHLDKAGCSFYEQQLQQFETRWLAAVEGWQQRLALLRGKSVVQYHESFDDLAQWLGVRIIANIEPVPGVPPSAGHLQSLLSQLNKEHVVWIVQESFRDQDAGTWLSEKTGIAVKNLPCDVNAMAQTETVFKWFERLVSVLEK
jgi:zinc/manganese transport system substrate-binding protein